MCACVCTSASVYMCVCVSANIAKSTVSCTLFGHTSPVEVILELFAHFDLNSNKMADPYAVNT